MITKAYFKFKHRLKKGRKLAIQIAKKKNKDERRVNVSNKENQKIN